MVLLGGAALAAQDGASAPLTVRLSMESVFDSVRESTAGPAAPDVALGGAVSLPLLARGRTCGVLVLARGPRKNFPPADLALADDLAGRGAVALDNARLYQNIQEGDRRKNEFLAMLAHELRNPLAPIRNAVQVLRLIGLKEPTLCQARDMIDRQVTHMARLIDDLLDMSRLSLGKILLRKEPVDLVQPVRAAVDDYRSSARGNGLKLHAVVPDDSVVTLGDPVRWRRSSAMCCTRQQVHGRGRRGDGGGSAGRRRRRARLRSRHGHRHGARHGGPRV